MAYEERLLRVGKLAIEGERNPPASLRAVRPHRFDSFSCDLPSSAERKDDAREEAESSVFSAPASLQQGFMTSMLTRLEQHVGLPEQQISPLRTSSIRDTAVIRNPAVVHLRLPLPPQVMLLPHRTPEQGRFFPRSRDVQKVRQPSDREASATSLLRAPEVRWPNRAPGRCRPADAGVPHWRHTGITNAAGAGMSPLAIMRMAGHADFKTTQRYIDLAGVVFGDEVRRLSDWYTAAGTKNRYEVEIGEAESRSRSGLWRPQPRSS